MSRLTFIVPVFDPSLDLLRRCIKSLVDQSLKEWDLVAVLDGPNKAAADAIRSEMKKSKNHFKIVEIEHGGAPRARNEGFKHAKGEFVVFLDCDCLIEVDVAKTWVEMFDKYPDVGFVYSGYKFLNERGAIESESFDPWLLRVRNYISSCFPLRRDLFPGWDESLESLQDWDFWLSVVEKGGKGHFLRGFAFSTAFPTPKSISGKGCTDEAWLDRVNAVKKKHGLPDREICVTALGQKHEGVWLGKVLDADYQDLPNSKPHSYKTFVHLGFSFVPGWVEHHCGILADPSVKHVVYYTCDNVAEVTSRLNLEAIWKYSGLLNSRAHKQFVEDKTAADIMRKAGFDVEVRSLPMAVEEPPPLPETPRFAVDIAPQYAPVFNVIARSMPDVELVNMSGVVKLAEVKGLCHFHPDRTVSQAMKRAVLAGRAVVSNVPAPFMGRVDDSMDLSEVIPAIVNKIRAVALSPVPEGGRKYYAQMSDARRFLDAIA